MKCASCKHLGRCDGVAGDDCYEPVPPTPRQEVRFDDDMTLAHAYSMLQRMRPGVRVNRSIKLSGKFVTLERASAMRATL